MKGRKGSEKLLAFVLAFTMLIPQNAISVLAESDDFAETAYVQEIEPVTEAEPAAEATPIIEEEPEPEPVAEIEPVEEPAPAAEESVPVVEEPEPEPVAEIEPVEEPAPAAEESVPVVEEPTFVPEQETMEEDEIGTFFSYESNDRTFYVSVEAPEEAKLPADAVLHVDYLAQNTAEYADAMSLIENTKGYELTGGAANAVLDHVLYDLYFTSSTVEGEIQPQNDQKLKVTMNWNPAEDFGDAQKVADDTKIRFTTTNLQMVNVGSDRAVEILSSAIHTNEDGSVYLTESTLSSLSIIDLVRVQVQELQEHTEETAEQEDGTAISEENMEDETAASEEAEDESGSEAAKTEFTYEDERVIIHAVAAEEANLPQSAKIRADYIVPGTDSYADAAAKLMDGLDYDAEEIIEFVLYDVYFEADGERIEPEDGTVQVTMEFVTPIAITEDVDLNESTIVHLKENGEAEELEGSFQTTADGDVSSMVFTSESFSIIGMTLASSQSNNVNALGVTLEGGAEYSLDNPMGDTPGNAANWVQTDNSYLKVENTEGQMVDAKTLTEIPNYPKFDLKLVYKVPADNTLTPNDAVTYTLPSWISKLDVTSGSVKFGKKEIGTWEIDDNKVVIRYTDTDFLNKYRETGFVGNVSLTGLVQTSYSEDTDTYLDLNYLGIPDSRVKVVDRSVKIQNMDIKKRKIGDPVYDVVSDNFIKQNYEIKVKAGVYDHPEIQQNNGDLENVYIQDLFKSFEKWQFRTEAQWREANELLNQYLGYEINSISILNGSGLITTDGRKLITVTNAGTENETETNIASETGDVTYKLVNEDGSAAVLRPDEQIIINYNAIVNKEFLETEARGYSQDLNNYYSGKADNALKSANDTNSNRSWTIRKIENKAVATTSSILKDDKSPAEFFAECNELNNQSINLEKTWLWKNGDPQGEYQSSYIIKVNEGTPNKIKGWTLTDNLNDYDQELITDVTIKYKDSNGNFAIEKTLSREEVTNNIISYTFERNCEYEITFSAQFTAAARTGENAHGRVECLNGAVLTETDSNSTKEDTFGVYETHTIAGNTITKRYDKRDIQKGLVRWITTIDAARSENPENLVIKQGAVYRDFIGWYRKDSETGTTYYCETAKGSPYEGGAYDGTYASARKDHSINTDQSVMDLVVTAETKDGVVTLTRNVDYKVRTFDEVDADSTIPNWNDAKRVGEQVCDGFDVVFLHDVAGNVQIAYNTVANFSGVTYEETFTNYFLYYHNGSDFLNPNSNNWNQASTTYKVTGAIKKTNETPADTKDATVNWKIEVNADCYETAQLQVRDTIPQEFDFKLTADCLEFTKIIEGQPGVGVWDLDVAPFNDAWKAAFKNSDSVPRVNNDLFDIKYDELPRQLRILLKDTYKKDYQIKLNTKPSADTLFSLRGMDQSDTRRKIDNTAWLYANDEVPDGDAYDISHWSANAILVGELVEKGYPKYNMPYATYTIEVNPAKVKMSDTGRITLSDTVGSNQMILMPKSIKVYEGTIPNVNADNVKAEVEKLNLLNASQYTVNVTTENDVATGFELDLPDEKQLVVAYDVYVVGKIGTQVNLSNNATLKYGVNKTVTSGKTKEETVGSPDFNTEVPNQINVEKVDRNDYSKKLKGAEFTIYDHDHGDSVIGTFVAGDNGIANSITNAKEEDKNALRDLKFGVHYILKETKAPYGYDLDQNFAVVFLFYSGNSSEKYDGKEIDVVGENQNGVKVIYMNVDDYTVVARDEKLPTVDIPVRKTWVNDFETYRPEQIVFALKYKVHGMEEAAYALDADGGKILLRMNEDNLIDTDDMNIWEGKFTDLPAVDANGKIISYYVEEENVKNYLTEYGDTKEVICDTADTAKFTPIEANHYEYTGAFDVNNKHLDFTRTIKGIAWKDTTKISDGLLETGDSPLAGVKVTLWLKMGEEYIRAKDRNGNLLPEVTTGVDGAYEFTNLLEGTYEVRFEQESYTTKQTIKPENARANNSIASQTGKAGEEGKIATISGIVLPNDDWMDANKNNIESRYSDHPYAFDEENNRIGAMFTEDHSTYVLPWQNAGFIEYLPEKKEVTPGSADPVTDDETGTVRYDEVTKDSTIIYQISFLNYHAKNEQILITDPLDESLDFVNATFASPYTGTITFKDKDNNDTTDKTKARAIIWTVTGTTDEDGDGHSLKESGVVPYASGYVELEAKVNTTGQKKAKAAMESNDADEIALIPNTATVKVGEDNPNDTNEVENPIVTYQRAISGVAWMDTNPEDGFYSDAERKDNAAKTESTLKGKKVYLLIYNEEKEDYVPVFRNSDGELAPATNPTDAAKGLWKELDATGYYEFTDLPEGTYKIVFDIDKYVTRKDEGADGDDDVNAARIKNSKAVNNDKSFKETAESKLEAEITGITLPSDKDISAKTTDIDTADIKLELDRKTYIVPNRNAGFIEFTPVKDETANSEGLTVHVPATASTETITCDTLVLDDTITYTISYYNYHAEARTITIIDTLDEGVTFVSANPANITKLKAISTDGAETAAVNDAETRFVKWSIPNVAKYTGGKVTLTVRVNEKAREKALKGTKTIINTATVQVGNGAGDTQKTNEVDNPVVAYKRNISGVAWLDADKDGLYTDKELATKDFAGKTVELLVKDEITGKFVAAKDSEGKAFTSTVKADGFYRFEDVPAGEYQVRFVIDEYVTKKGEKDKDGSIKTNSKSDNETTKHNAITGSFTLPTDNQLHTEDAYKKNIADDGEKQYDLASRTYEVPHRNAGFLTWEPVKKEIIPGPATREIVKNGNTVYDAVSVGEDITYDISCYNYDAKADSVTITDELDEGLTFKSATPENSYKLYDKYGKETQTAADARKIVWTITAAPYSGEGHVTLTATVNKDARKDDKAVQNKAIVTVNNHAQPTNEVENPVNIYSRSISGVAWMDENKDGVYTEKELKDKDEMNSLEGKEVILLVKDGTEWKPAADEDGKAVPSQKIKEDGSYEFTNLPEGIYRVEFKIDSYVTEKGVGTDNKINSKVENTPEAGSEKDTVLKAVTDEIRLPDDLELSDKAVIETADEVYKDKHYEVPNRNAGFITYDPVKTESVPGSEEPIVKGSKIIYDTVSVGQDITYEISYYNYDAKESTVTITDELDAGLNFKSAEPANSYKLYDKDNEETQIASDARKIVWTIPVQPYTEEGYVTLTATVNEDARKDDKAVRNKAAVTVGNDTKETNEAENLLDIYTRSISGVAWMDADRNGIYTASELKDKDGKNSLAGSKTVLYVKDGETWKTAVDEDGKPVPAQEIGEDGSYRFTNLPEGTYKIEFEIDQYVTEKEVGSDNEINSKTDNDPSSRTADHPVLKAVTGEYILPSDLVLSAMKETNTADEFYKDKHYEIPNRNAGFIEFKPEKKETDNSLGLKTTELKADGTTAHDTLIAGDEITYSISYYNYHPDKATVTIIDELDKDVTFVSASFAAAVTMLDAKGVETSEKSEARTIRWEIDPVAAYTGGTVTLKVKVSDKVKEAALTGTKKVENIASVQVGNFAGEKADTNKVENPVQAFTRSIDGVVWLDADRDGNLEAGEKLQEKITVTLYKVEKDGEGKETRTPAGTTETDENGAYHFGSLEPGDYEIVFDDDRVVTKQSEKAAADKSIADDTHTITKNTLPTDQEIRDSKLADYPGTFDEKTGDYNLPYQNLGVTEYTRSISGTTWFDQDQNGKIDTGDKASDELLNGIIVELWKETTKDGKKVYEPVKDPDGKPVTTITEKGADGTDGYYEFTDLEPGTYKVVFEKDTDLTEKEAKGADTSENSKASRSEDKKSAFIEGIYLPTDEELAEGKTYKPDTNGSYERPYQNAGFIWNPVKAETKPGKDLRVVENDEIVYTITYKNYKSYAADVVVTDNLDPKAEIVSQTSDDKGAFDEKAVTWTFTKLPAGKEGIITLTVKVKAGASKAETQNIINTATIKVGQDPGQKTNEIRNPIDGYTRSIDGVVWLDADRDGNLEAGENLQEKITVTLYKVEKDGEGKETRTPAGTTETDENGAYHFGSLEPGDYEIIFDDDRVVTKQSEKAAADKSIADDTHTITKITLPTDQEIRDSKLADYPGTFDEKTGDYNLPYQNLGVTEYTKSVSGTVWLEDTGDDDGSMDAGEERLEGITVQLIPIDENGNPVKAVEPYEGKTDKDGYFEFKDVPSGDYKIVFDTDRPVTVKEAAGVSDEQNSKVVPREDGTSEITKVTVPTDKQILELLQENPKAVDENGNFEIPNQNAGVKQFTRSLDGVAWLDRDKDGKLDDNERLLSGIEVKLYIYETDEEGNKVLKEIGITTTNEKGYYSFADLEPGEYEIEFVEELEVTEQSDTAAANVSITDESHRITGITLPTDEEIAADSTKYPTEDGNYNLPYQNMGVLNPEAPQAQKPELKVTKKLVLDDDTEMIAADQSFYVALFADEEGTQRVSEVKEIHFHYSSSETVIFDELDPGWTCCVKETDKDGAVIESGMLGDVIYVAEMEDAGKTEIPETGTVEFSFENRFYDYPDGFYMVGSIEITKKVLGTDKKPKNTTDVFHAGIFTDEAHTTLSSQVDTPIVTLDPEGGSEVTVAVAAYLNPEGETKFYIAETDEAGKPVDDGFAYAAEIDQESVTLDQDHITAEVTITNTEKPQATVTVTPTPTPTQTPTSQSSGRSVAGTSGVSSSNSPKTGDDSPIGMNLLLLALALGSITILLNQKKKARK